MCNRAARLMYVLIAALALTGCGAEAARDAGTASALAAAHTRADPLTGSRLYVNPENQASVEIRRLQAQGDTQDANLLQRIATQPVATWFTNSSPQLDARVGALASAATAQHEQALIVAYAIPQRDCGAGFSAGGAATPAAYLAWIDRLATAIGSRRAVVILEPDAIPDIADRCVNGGAARARLELLSRAVTTLKDDRNVLVYLDAGNAGWIKPTRKLVAPLRAAGLARADGFALNVANFQSTAASVAYGDKLSGELDGAHFVIDTSRNGNGADTNSADTPTWCNPPGRALGHTPTTSTKISRVDALLWIKPPGISDGSCRPGAPPAGQWWTQYALELAAATHP
jgi:endoglucanase